MEFIGELNQTWNLIKLTGHHLGSPDSTEGRVLVSQKQTKLRVKF